MSGVQGRIAANVAAASETYPQHGGAADPLRDPAEGWDSPLGRVPSGASAYFGAMAAADERIALMDRSADLLLEACEQLIVFRARLGIGDRQRAVDALMTKMRSAAGDLRAQR